MGRERQCPRRSGGRETAQLEAPGHAPPPWRRGSGPCPVPSRGRGRSCPRGAQRQPSLREGASSLASRQHSTNRGGGGGSTQNRSRGSRVGGAGAQRGRGARGPEAVGDCSQTFLCICRWVMEKAREFQKNIYFCFIDYAKAFDSVDHNKL